jgi:predicted dehydrogenase
MNDLPQPQTDALDVSRRDFVKTSSFAAAFAMFNAGPLLAPAQNAAAPAAAEPEGPTIKCAVIGVGTWGREILNTLARFPKAEVIAICDHYESPVFQRRMKEAAPKAQLYTDYTKVLENKDVQAVIVSTPTHQHKEIVVAALKAGKHVYCEAPLANTIEDARTIARAARDATKSYFQAGLNLRSDPQRKFLLPFVRIGATGRNVKTRAQWHKKMIWRRKAPTDAREHELNWNLRKESSTGLIGELGSQQIDTMHWFLDKRPVAVSGFGGILHWQDGREIEDTAQAVFQYGYGTLFNYEACIATSFDSQHEILYGSDAAIMLRGNKAWLFKEADSPLLGWEVYARKEQFFDETGIALVANATKSSKTAQSKSQEEAAYSDPPIYFAMEAFLANTELIANSIEDFTAIYNTNDPKALQEYLAGVAKNKLSAASYVEGYEAAVLAIKANEAVMKKTTIKFDKQWFEI